MLRRGASKWARLLCVLAVAVLASASAEVPAFAAESPVALSLVPDTGSLPVAWLTWLQGAQGLVPFPSATVTVHNASCPTGSAEPSCVDWDGTTATLYYDQAAVIPEERRATLLHECGHIYDHLAMPEEARAKWLQVMQEQRPWRTTPNSPHEQFAEAYSMMARGFTFAKAQRYGEFGGYDFNPTRKQYRRIAILLQHQAALLRH